MLERRLSKGTRACPIRSRFAGSKAVIDVAWMYVGKSAGEGRELKRERPPAFGLGGSQTYMLIIPGSVAPATLRALKGSQGRHHITRGNKILGRLGPRFSSILVRLAVSRTPGQTSQGWERVPRSACKTLTIMFSESDVRQKLIASCQVDLPQGSLPLGVT